MKRFNSFYSLNVFSLQTKTWDFPEHKHNFYELILIENGSGSQTLNGVTFPYFKNDVFLLTADDSHHFTITEETTFIFVKFTEQVFIEKLDGNKKSDWYSILIRALQNPNLQPGNIMQNAQDLDHVFTLVNILKCEFIEKKRYAHQTTLELFGVVMLLVARNIDSSMDHKEQQSGTDKVNSILSYIRANIFDSEKMRIKALAAEFYMSPNYISIFIRKNTGIALQQLIMQTKLKVAEQLLTQSKMNVNEIAARLGFTDASHFNKLYKKYKLVNPTDVRK